MIKKIIFHLIFAIVGAFAYYLFFNDVLMNEAIVFAFVYFVSSTILGLILSKMKSNEKNQITTVNTEKVTAFIDAIGGIGNIIEASSASSRLKVVIKDSDLINQDKLTALELSGAYLAGNQLQITIGSNTDDFLHQIHEVMK